MRSQRRETWSSFLASVGKSSSRQSVVGSLAFTVPFGTSVFYIGSTSWRFLDYSFLSLLYIIIYFISKEYIT